MIQVFKIFTPDGDIEYWATNDLKLGDLQRLWVAEFIWVIENYHQGHQAILWERGSSIPVDRGPAQPYCIGYAYIMGIS